MRLLDMDVQGRYVKRRHNSTRQSFPITRREVLSELQRLQRRSSWMNDETTWLLARCLHLSSQPLKPRRAGQPHRRHYGVEDEPPINHAAPTRQS